MRARVVPVEGRIVRHPKTGRRIREDGQDEVVVSSYWSRLERDGDIELEPVEEAEQGEE